MTGLELMALGAAMGLGKSYLIDQPKEKRERELAARTIELSPWTGLKANAIQEADPFGSALKYGATGYSAADDYADKEFKKEMMKAMAGKMAGGESAQNINPYAGLATAPNYGMQSKYGLYGGE
jgi:hypothetical protein